MDAKQISEEIIAKSNKAMERVIKEALDNGIESEDIIKKVFTENEEVTKEILGYLSTTNEDNVTDIEGEDEEEDVPYIEHRECSIQYVSVRW